MSIHFITTQLVMLPILLQFCSNITVSCSFHHHHSVAGKKLNVREQEREKESGKCRKRARMMENSYLYRATQSFLECGSIHTLLKFD
jgi:hypothetical protein